MDKPKYRMIAIDLDGTLLSPQGKVTERVKAAVHRALSAGLLVCFATGRNWTESRTVLEAVAHYDSAVFVGGAIVIDTRNEVTLHQTMVQPQLAREICQLLEGRNHAVLALQETGVAGVDYLISEESPMNEATTHWLKMTSATVHHVRKLSEHPHPHTIRLGIVAEAEEIEQTQRELDEKFAERIFVQRLLIPTVGVEVLEIFDPAVNKWQGVLHVARRHGIKPQEIVAIGDDMNDLPMIANAGLGVAMGNARPEVQAIAKRVIGTNQEEGLANFLDELVTEHLVEPMPPNERHGEAAA